MPTQETTALLQWFEDIGKFGFGPLVALLLFGNFLGIWVWGRFHRERLSEKDIRIAELKTDIVAITAEKNQWKEMALGLLNPLESTVRGKNRG